MAMFGMGVSMSGYIKGDDISLSTSQTVTIQTGLSSIKHFSISQRPKWDGTYYTFSQAIYDNTNSAKYCASGFNGASSFGSSQNLGTTADSNGRCITINSVSGGNVAITAPSVSLYTGDYVWCAE